jgi:hypothetical protein
LSPGISDLMGDAPTLQTRFVGSLLDKRKDGAGWSAVGATPQRTRPTANPESLLDIEP